MGKIKKIPEFKLNNGTAIPSMGLGTGIIWIYEENRVKTVLKYIRDIIFNKAHETKISVKLYNVAKEIPVDNYVMVDTAQAYGQCERILGKAWKKIKRENLYVITKLSNTDQRKGDVKAACYESMRKLGIDYIDLYLMHWPNPDTYVDCWRQMEELYESGVVKAIGVCNFHKCHLENLLKNCRIKPMVDQFEHHPLLTQEDLVEYCKKNDIQVMAYAPTAVMNEKIKNNNCLKALAEKYNKTISQIIFRWNFQNNIISIPATKNIHHYFDNIDIYDFELTDKEMADISSQNVNFRVHPDPENCDFMNL
jgi:diketogulonate reductase-like aldo/keto reductase